MIDPPSLPASYFEAKYALDPDPWRFATSDYEARKYRATLAALPRPRFERALEAGCSIGVLTERLAERCDALIAFDLVPAVLSQARARARHPHVVVERRALPHDWPEGDFDLIVFSEILYYLGRRDLLAVAASTRASLRPGGAVVLVHWLGPTDYPLTGDAASTLFIEALHGMAHLTRSSREPEYRLDVLLRPA